MFGFGPVNDDCIGVGYAVTAAGATFNVTQWRRNGDAAVFSEALNEAVHELALIGVDHKAMFGELGRQ